VSIQSSKERVDAIEAWFHSHDDGDFGIAPDGYDSVRVGNPMLAKTVIYTTKNACLSRVRSLSQLPSPMAVIGRYGLPTVDDLPFVFGSSPSRIFIGDCDPPDILIFSWLREHLPIVWHGVNDNFLELHRTRFIEWIWIPMSVSEREAVSLLPELCPDYRKLIGDYCASVLEDGFKIEIEGAIIDRDAIGTG
jgi:hypothetical protein